ncbi:MAG: ABC transporter ATP-binding protein/permease [Proteobacteria bacterium]|nr:ABC transporter ATP-binding protein/permease [Pseudomonadota bacterium]
MDKSLTIKKLCGYLWPKNVARVKALLLGSISLLIIGRLFVLGGPIAFKYLIDHLKENPQVFPTAIIIGFVVVRILAQTCNELRDYTFNIVSQRIFRQISVSVFSHLHSLSLKFHLNRQTGGLSRVIERGTKSLESISLFLMMTILPSLIESILLATLLWFWYSPICSLIMIMTMTTYVVFTIFVSTWRLKIVKQMNELDNTSQTRAIDSLLNFETVKYFGNEQLETERFDQVQAVYEKTSRKFRSSLNFLNAGQAVIFSIGLGGMLTFAIIRASTGEITPGDVAALFAFSLQLVMPLFNLGFAYREIKQGIINLGEMFSLLDQESDVKDSSNAKPLTYEKGKITFENLSFSYNEDRKIINNINLVINPGETVAFVGTTGGGKSTLSRLLFRLYDPSNGRILIDDQDIKKVTQASLRQAIGIVPQDTVLFNDTIAYNIGYGAPLATFTEIQNAAKNADLDEFISKLSEGYETKVGERGLKLSGGEKQRVAIARMLLKKPKIYIFDEATSALDTTTEKRIQQSLQKISHGSTTIIIAHRLSTIVDADHIFVLDQGAIAESGNHQQLLKQNGLYAKLWNQQIHEEKPDIVTL